MEDIKFWTIYKLTSPTGRVYIGKTVSMVDRMSCYRCINVSVKKQNLLHQSLVKYSFENHKLDILDEFESGNDYASGKEMFWIRSFMSNKTVYVNHSGLNLTLGGEGMWGRKASKETREKQSLAKKGKTAYNKGKPMPLHQIEILRAINTGKPSWRKGVKFEGTEEERKEKFGKHNIGNSYNKGRKQSEEVVQNRIAKQIGRPLVKKWKPILQFDFNGNLVAEYESVKSASALSGISKQRIYRVAAGIAKTNTTNYIFKYKI